MKAKSKKIYALKEIIKRRDLTGLFLRSSMYDSTPWFSISWTVFSISVAAVCHIYNTDNSVFHSLCEYDYFLEFLSVKCVRKETKKMLTYLRKSCQSHIPSLWYMSIGQSVGNDGTRYGRKLYYFTWYFDL